VVVHFPVKIEVIENGNIDIECKVNLLTTKPVWRHNGTLLQSSGRKVILTKGTTHKLMITNVTLHDEGEYTVAFGNVSSKTTVQIQRNIFECYLRFCNTDTIYKLVIISIKSFLCKS
jgi:hypothetical protein